MSHRPPGLDALVAEATRLASQAASRLLADPRGQAAMARAVGVAQRSLQRIEALQVELMTAAGVPGRHDVQALARQLARVKRKARALSERLAARHATGAGRGPEAPAGGDPTPAGPGDPGAR